MAGTAPIVVRHPLPHDIVADPVHLTGIGTAFEGKLGARVRDRAGNVLIEIGVAAGGTGFWGDYGVDLPLGGTPATTLGAVEVFEISARDGSDLHLQVVPVAFGTALRPTYVGFALHRVEPGESLFSIAKQFYDDGDLFPIIFDANRDVLDRTDVITQGQLLRVPL